MENTMLLWDQVRKVDLNMTKTIDHGYKGTSINGYWFIKKATELWGPIGSKWGYQIIRNEYRDGPLMISKQGDHLGHSCMHTMEIALHYPGCNEPVHQIGHTPYIYLGKYGPICDMEVEKKSLTDALKKALSMLGFAGEIYEGEFDDEIYKAGREMQQRLEEADSLDRERERLQEEMIEYFRRTAGLVEAATTVTMIKGLMTSTNKKVRIWAQDRELSDLANRSWERLQEVANERQQEIAKEKGDVRNSEKGADELQKESGEAGASSD